MAATGYNIRTTSAEISFRDQTTGLASISYDHATETLNISHDGTGDISIGDTSSDIYIGDGINNVDVIYETDGGIYADSGSTLTIGLSTSNVEIDSPTLINNDLDVTGSLDVTGNITMTGATVATQSWVSSQNYLTSETDDQTLDDVLAQGNTSTRDMSVGAITGSALTIDTDTLYVDAANNRVGIGTDGPAHPLVVQGASAVSDTNIGLTDSGGTSRLTMGYNSVGAYINGGSIGVGTSELRIRATNNSPIRIGAHNGYVMLEPGPYDGTNKYEFRAGEIHSYIRKSDGNQQKASVIHHDVYDETNNYTSIALATLAGTTEAQGLIVKRYSNGNRVGIGTTSPDAKLQIDTSTSNGGGEGVRINRPSAGTHYHAFELATNGTVDWSVGQNINDSFEIYENGAAATTRLSIKEGGNVGIGTTSPLAKTHISSHSQQPVAAAIQSESKLVISGTDGNMDLLSRDDNSTVANSIGLGRYSITDGSIIHKFGIVHWANTGSQGSNTGDRLAFSYGASSDAWSNSELVTIKSDGNVGIGDTTPSYKLDVAGTLRTTSAAYFNNDVVVTNNLTLTGANKPTFTTPDDTVYTPSYNWVTATPFNAAWHDLIAFDRNYTTTQEISTDGTNFSSDTLELGLFDQKDKTKYEVVGNGERAVRWTWTGVAYNVGRYFHIAAGYSSPAPSCTVKIETSSDGSTWTEIHSSSGISFSATNRFYYVDPSVGADGDNYVRLTIDKGNTDTKTINVTSIKMLTQRLGDQGKGREDELPFYYDKDQNIGIGATSPNAKLQVNDNVRIGNGSTGVRFYIQGVDEFRADALDVDESGWNSLHLRADGTDGLFLEKDTNNVGIGTTSPTSPLTIKSNSFSSSDSALTIQGNTNTNAIVKIAERATDGARFHMYDGGVEKIAFYTDGTDNHISAGNVGIGDTTPSYKLDVNGTLRSTGAAYFNSTVQIGSSLNMTDGDITSGYNIYGNYFRQRQHGIPRNNLGDPTVTEMALFEPQFTCKTDLSNSYNDLSDLTLWVQATSSDEWTEVTSYSDDNKRKFLRTNNSSVIIPNGSYKYRVEFNAQNYTFANALYMYWSSNSHRTQVHVWKYNVLNDAWTQHTSSSSEISSWPGHMWLPFSTIAWHETATTSGGHYKKVRIEFTPTWVPYSGSGTDYSGNNINLYGGQIWGGYPRGRRTPHYYDQNGLLTTWGQFKISDIPSQSSEATALVVNTSNVVGYRELGSNAFNSSAFITASSTDTLTNKTWNGNVIASAYLDADTAHLSGTQTFSGAKTFSSGLNISVSTSNTQLKLKRTGTATGEFNIYTNNDTLFFNNVGQSSYPMVIDEDGNVGIGTTSPNARLELKGSTADSSENAFVARDSASASLFSIRNDGRVDATGNVVIGGDLTVNGTTSTINSTTLQVDDKNIELGTVATPTDTTADGGGITLKGATDKTINWYNATDAWTSNQDFIVDKGTSNRTTKLTDDGLYISRTSDGGYVNCIKASSNSNHLDIKARSYINLILNSTTVLTLHDTGKVAINGSIGDQTLYVNGDVKINTIAAGTTDTDKFLISDGGIVKYRTGAQVLSDIGAASSSHTHANANSTSAGFMSDAHYDKLEGIAANADVTPSWVPSTNPNYLTSLGTAIVDGDFTANGLMKRTGAGIYTSITDNSSNWNTAYTHTSATNNPHSVTATQVGLGNVTDESKATMFTNPTFTGNVGFSHKKVYGFQRTLPTTVNDIVEIGDTTLSSGAGHISMQVVVASSNFSVTKSYTIPIGYNETSGVWNLLNSTYDTGPYSSNDFEVDIKIDNGNIALRIRRTSGSTAGLARVNLELSGATLSFTETSSTASVTAPTAYYNPNVISQKQDGLYIGGTRKDSNWDTAYTHVSATNNPHSVTASQVAAYTSAETDTLLNAKQNTLTFGISNTNTVKIDSTSVADNEYARFTANGLESRSTSEVKSDIGLGNVVNQAITVTSTSVSDGTSTFNKATLASLGTDAFDNAGTYANLRAQATTKDDVGLGNVENTALSTWAGSTNITTVGTITSGEWNGSVIASAYLDSDTAHLSGTQTFSGVNTFSSDTTFNGKVGIGVTPSSAEFEVNGHFAATTKSFIVDNPKTGGKLQYGVVESDQHSVFVRGKNDTNTIELPEEWEWLVDPDSVTVQFTSIGQIQQLFVVSQDNKKIKIGGLAHNGQYNYTVYGERVDVDKLQKHLK